MTNCLYCGKKFNKPYRGGYPAKFCTKSCKEKNYRMRKAEKPEVKPIKKIPVMHVLIDGELKSVNLKLPVYGFWGI